MPTPRLIAEKLSAWLPALIRAWREQSKNRWSNAPADRLLPQEAKSLAAGLQRLSQGLTRNRELPGEQYFSDPSLFGAYLLYFWPISYIQASWMLCLLPSVPAHVLDLGCGAGPLAAAAWDLGSRKFTLADRSAKALGWAKSLLNQPQTAIETASWNPLSGNALPGGKFDLVCLQHSLNELWSGSGERAVKRTAMLTDIGNQIQPNGRLLLIEPALKSTSQDLISLRDNLCAAGWQVNYPCLHSQRCPALAQDDSCHTEFPWEAPAMIKDLLQRAGLHKPVIKMTSLLLSRETRSANPVDTVLVTSEVRRAKNKDLFVRICTPQGLQDLTLRPADRTVENQTVLKCHPGDQLRVHQTAAQPVGQRLTAESRVEIIRPADGLAVVCE